MASAVEAGGPSSCMDGEHDFHNLVRWPTAPYGAGDLAVAYTKNANGRIQSRCLCWPEKKLFGRIYGDFQRMKAAMEAEGFPDYTANGKVFTDDGEVFAYGDTDEEPESIIAWYGPLTAPPCDCF
jgi:hypothetical protein